MRRNLMRAGGLLLGILLLLALGLALAPRWINLDPIRLRIIETASKTLGANLSYDHLDLTLFPRPRITLQSVAIEIPGKVDGTVSALEITPTIVSLIRGNVLLARVRAEALDFRITLSPAGKEKAPTLQDAREKAAGILSALSASIPGAVIEISRGRLTLLRDDGTRHVFTDISARIDAPPDTLRVEIRCASNLWDRMTAKFRLDPDGLKAMGEIRVTRLAADRLAPFIPTHAAIGYSGAFPDFEIDFESEAFRTLRADFKGTVPAISVRRSVRRSPLAARAVLLSGAIRLDEKALALTDLKLSSDAPPLKASGAFSLALPASRASVSFRADNVDIPAVREAVLAFAGDVAPFPDIFDWIRGGRIPALTITSQAGSPSGLGTLEAITLRGTLQEGKVHIGPGSLDLDEVNGDVSLARGTLTATRVSSRMGNSQASEGSVAISFRRKGKPTPFRIDTQLRADLAQLPAVMARLPLPGDAAALFAGITSLAGNATGRLMIEGDGTGIRTAVTASSIRLSGRHRKVPLPFTVTDGSFALSGATIRVGGHAGTIGRTKFSGIEGRMQVGGEYLVDNVSGRIEADLGELSAWFASVPGMKAATGGVAATGGKADISISRLEGPLLRPRALRFEGSGTVQETRFDGGKLPGPLTLHSGKIRATHASLAFEALRGSMLDADLHGSGTWSGFREGRLAFETSGVGGVLGPEAVGRLASLGKIPADFRPRAPIALAGVRATFSDDNGATLAGTFSVSGGPVIGLDLAARPGTLEIRSVSLRDESSDATASLTKSPDALALRFSGRLAASSIGRLFPARKSGNEWLSGEIRLRVPNDNVLRLSATGTLEAKALRFPELLGPLAVSRLSIEAMGDRVSIREADLAWDGKPFTVKGMLVNGTNGLSADLDLHAADLSWDEIEREVKRSAPPQGSSGRPWRFPVTGTVRASADAFTWKTLTWRPVRADVRFEPQAVSVVVKEAALCGIRMPGTIRVTPEGTSVDFKAAESGLAIDNTLSCLGETDFRMTGTASLSAHLTGEGRGDALEASLRGPVSFEARKGRIHKANILMKVLALLNVTQVLVGKLPDLAEDGFAYSALTFTGTVGNGKLVVPDLVLDAASANIAAEGAIDLGRKEVDGVLLASPFKTVDAIIRMIPVVRYILKGRLVAVPFKIRGPIGDPGVSILAPAEVGAGLLGVVERTLKLPVHLIAPLLPDEKSSPGPRRSP